MSPDRNPPLIPLFGQNVRHSSVPAKSCSAIARGGGQGWSPSRPDSASPLTAASTMAGLRPLGTVICIVAILKRFETSSSNADSLNEMPNI
jgi:hypothetical protein